MVVNSCFQAFYDCLMHSLIGFKKMFALYEIVVIYIDFHSVRSVLYGAESGNAAPAPDRMYIPAFLSFCFYTLFEFSFVPAQAGKISGFLVQKNPSSQSVTPPVGRQTRRS